MENWRQVLHSAALNLENRFDGTKERLAARLGKPASLVIVPYWGYGSAQQLRLHGRVLRNPKEITAVDNDTLWDNLVDMYGRFTSDEVPYPQVWARYGHVEQTVTGNEEGYFTITLVLPEPISATGGSWHEIELTLCHPKPEEPVQATGHVFVPSRTARFGIISDIDDTIVVSHAADLLRMARTVFMGSAQTRLPFPGVAEFYNALHQGHNPLVYLSSSPWNLYDLLVDFFELQGIPAAPLFLRDWGITETELLPTQHKQYKLNALREVLDFYEELPFLLIGDSGQQDPEIYTEVVQMYPGRILAVYIRDVSSETDRDTAVLRLAEQVKMAGSTLILTNNTLAMAEHAAAEGWIDTAVIQTLPQG